MSVLHLIEIGVEIRGGVVVPVRHRILLEELETVVVADLLTGVDQRLGVRKCPAEDSHRLPSVAHPFIFSAGPRVLVMVSDERKPMAAGWIGSGIPFHIADKAVGSGLPLRDVVQQMVQFPGVGGVEAGLVQPRLLPLGEEVESAGIFRPELREHIGPEILRHLIGHVAAEAVDPPVKPETHALLHLGPHLLGLVVELGDVRPVIFDNRVALRVADVPVGRFPRHPRMIRRGVVGHPVDDDLEAKVVGRADKVVEILQGAELRVDVAIVLDGVVGAESSLAAFLADRIDRHQPDNVHPKFLKFRKFPLGRGEGTFGGRLTGVQFIDHGVAGPVTLNGSLSGIAPAGEHQNRGKQNE